jgi:polyphosphate kinase 2 (PPK2 family)
LSLSKDEQKHRQLRRLNKPNKNWKFSPGDLDERELWHDYMRCYEDAINRTSKPNAPWYVIPSDDKPTARYIVAKILLEELQKYKDIKEPELDEKIRSQIEEYKKRLKND